MLNFIVVFCGFFIAVALARIIIPRILIISLRKRLFDTPDRKSTRLNSSHIEESRMPSSA